MPILKTLTVDEMIELLTKMKEEHGGDERVYVSNPCDDGIGWDTLPISDVHMGNSTIWVQVPVKKEIEGETG